MRKKWYWLRYQKKGHQADSKINMKYKRVRRVCCIRKLGTLLFMYIYVTMLLIYDYLDFLDVLDPSPEPSLEVALQACHTRLQGGTSCVAGTRGSGGGGAPDVDPQKPKDHLRPLAVLKTDRQRAFHLSPPILGGNLRPDSGTQNDSFNGVATRSHLESSEG